MSDTGVALAFLAIVVIILLLVAGSTMQMPSPSTETDITTVLGVSVDPLSVDWGTLQPGDKANRTVMVTNAGNATSLWNFTTQQWTPEVASLYLSLSWNYTGEPVEPLQTVPVLLTLYVHPEIRDVYNFTFVIVIGCLNYTQPSNLTVT